MADGKNEHSGGEQIAPPHPIFNSQFPFFNNNKLRTQIEGKITGTQVAACGIEGGHGEGR